MKVPVPMSSAPSIQAGCVDRPGAFPRAEIARRRILQLRQRYRLVADEVSGVAVESGGDVGIRICRRRTGRGSTRKQQVLQGYELFASSCLYPKRLIPRIRDIGERAGVEDRRGMRRASIEINGVVAAEVRESAIADLQIVAAYCLVGRHRNHRTASLLSDVGKRAVRHREIQDGAATDLTADVVLEAAMRHERPHLPALHIDGLLVVAAEQAV